MAFKIKSAKIFFGIKEHTVMLLSVVLSYLGRTATGYQQEEEKRRVACCHADILQGEMGSWRRSHWSRELPVVAQGGRGSRV